MNKARERRLVPDGMGNVRSNVPELMERVAAVLRVRLHGGRTAAVEGALEL
jgi:hypothetical protein